MAQRNDRGRETPPDPLKGEMVPKGYAPGVGPVASGATTKSKTGVPPLPAATSSPSPAEIVQRGPPDPLYGEQPSLAIGKTTGPTQPVASWQPNGPSGVLASGQGGAPPVGASLQEPVPMVAPRAGGLPGTVPPGTWSSAAGMSYDQLQDALAKFNPRSQRQETVPGGFKFTCEIPNPQRPEFSRHYEATARDYRSALLAVVEQVGRDRQGR
ncbi:MAG TPA: hypothetical protein VEL76_19090 [Gemmataceae bacterium]|nr:hypothetical protein [Gemmataceae bacterium]